MSDIYDVLTDFFGKIPDQLFLWYSVFNGYEYRRASTGEVVAWVRIRGDLYECECTTRSFAMVQVCTNWPQAHKLVESQEYG